MQFKLTLSKLKRPGIANNQISVNLKDSIQLFI